MTSEEVRTVGVVDSKVMTPRFWWIGCIWRGVQGARRAPGSAPSLGPAEMTALDVIGWNLTTKGKALEAIPEPGGYASVLLGGLLLGALRRRKMG